ncbi:hypothetical protein ACWDZ8_23735 [Streptomyces sp. NPDC003233]
MFSGGAKTKFDLGLYSSATESDLGRHREAADLLAVTAAARARTAPSDYWLVLKGRSDRLQHLAYLGLHEEVVAEAGTLKSAARGTEGIHRILLPLAVTNGLAFSLSLHGNYEQADTYCSRCSTTHADSARAGS